MRAWRGSGALARSAPESAGIAVDRGSADLRESDKGELRRIALPRTPVNRGKKKAEAVMPRPSCHLLFCCRRSGCRSGRRRARGIVDLRTEVAEVEHGGLVLHHLHVVERALDAVMPQPRRSAPRRELGRGNVPPSRRGQQARAVNTAGKMVVRRRPQKGVARVRGSDRVQQRF
jgi:hypothetical protein